MESAHRTSTLKRVIDLQSMLGRSCSNLLLTQGESGRGVRAGATYNDLLPLFDGSGV